jgi:Na+/proline symporter
LILAWVNNAFITILQGMFGLSYNDALMITAGTMIFVAIYSSASGLLGVAITDTFQFFIAMGGCVVLAALVLGSEQIGGMDGLKSKLEATGQSSVLQFFPKITGEGSAGVLVVTLMTFFAYVGVQWWASWFPGQEPGGGGYVAQRMMSAKNERHSILATLFFQLAHYAIRPWPWIIVGLCAVVLYPELSADDKKLGFVYAMRDFLPVGLKGLILVAFFSAYMSTISTHLNWGASYVVNDLYKRFMRRPAAKDEADSVGARKDDRHYVFVSRVVTLLLMVIGLISSTFVARIEDVWKFLMACGGGLGLVLILRWYWWRINAWAEIAATLAPFVGVAITFSLDGEGQPFYDYGAQLMFIVGLTTITWLVVMFATKPSEQKHLQAFYQRVRPWGSWSPVARSLGLTPTRGPIGGLIICWLSAVVGVYAILFATGELILLEWSSALIYIAVAAVALIVLLLAVRMTKVFSN